MDRHTSVSSVPIAFNMPTICNQRNDNALHLRKSIVVFHLENSPWNIFQWISLFVRSLLAHGKKVENPKNPTKIHLVLSISPHFHCIFIDRTSNGICGLPLDVQKRLGSMTVSRVKGNHFKAAIDDISYSEYRLNKLINFWNSHFHFDVVTSAPKSIPMEQMNQYGHGNNSMDY